MKIGPMIFSADMVQSILVGRKTQTRRIIKPQPKCKRVVMEYGFLKEYSMRGSCWNEIAKHRPLFQPEDIIWAREVWTDISIVDFSRSGYVYKADCYNPFIFRWKSPMCMPKAAARIFLRVTDVGVEKIRDISINDCIAEGIIPVHGMRSEIKNWFSELWDSLNAKRGYGWDKNPWVWKIVFERTKKPKGWPERGNKNGQDDK